MAVGQLAHPSSLTVPDAALLAAALEAARQLCKRSSIPAVGLLCRVPARRGICTGLKAAAVDWRAPRCAAGCAARLPAGRASCRSFREPFATGVHAASAAIARKRVLDIVAGG